MVGVASVKYVAESYKKGSGGSLAFVIMRQLSSRLCAYQTEKQVMWFKVSGLEDPLGCLWVFGVC